MKTFFQKLKYKLYSTEELRLLYDLNRLDYIYGLIKCGHFIDDYLKSEDLNILKMLIRCGHGIEKLINHPHKEIKMELIINGHGLDKFVADPDVSVSNLVKLYQNQQNFIIN